MDAGDESAPFLPFPVFSIAAMWLFEGTSLLPHSCAKMHLTCCCNPWVKDQRQSVMKFLNTATHPGTLFSRIGRRGSREDALETGKVIDE